MLKAGFSLLAVLLLSACLINSKLIGEPEPVDAAAWSGTWGLESLDTGEKHGNFRIRVIDAGSGKFVAQVSGVSGEVAEENASDDKLIEGQLRRVGDQLFVAFRASKPKKDRVTWAIFPVTEFAPGRLVICFMPDAQAFRTQVENGTLKAKVIEGIGDSATISFDDLSTAEIAFLSSHVSELWKPARTLLKRIGPAK